MAPGDFSCSYFLGARAAPDLVFVGEFRKNVTRQTWQALFHFGEYLFQSTRQNGECLKKMVSHTEVQTKILLCSVSNIATCFI
jgi:hypothetical protein